jgi:hypothetical protein
MPTLPNVAAAALLLSGGAVAAAWTLLARDRATLQQLGTGRGA